MENEYDLLVIGGGINGAAIARDASGRGYRVLLCEQNDLASATSSSSSKLIHGGLRYLEHYEFRLVRESLREREVLLRAAPHVIWPLRFVLPHHAGLRPAPLLRLGLFIYDHLGGREQLPPTRTLKLRHHFAGAPLADRYILGFEYSDCWVDDARLVVLNALDAHERGAVVMTHTRFTGAQRKDQVWQVTLSGADGSHVAARARAIVNAAGPWVMPVERGLNKGTAGAGVVLVKGSHIVMRKLYDGAQAYTLQGSDGRIVFMIPYEHDYTLIGTTDVPFAEDPAAVSISADETRYLCRTVSDYLRREVQPSDVVWSYAGIRPLYDDGASDPSAITRDYTLALSGGVDAPLLTVYGGKITTSRRLAEEAMDKLDQALGERRSAWTRDAPLPGGNMPAADFEAWLRETLARYPLMPPTLMRRLGRAYGTRIDRVLGDAQRYEDLGRDFGMELTEAELNYLIDTEWARNANDVLFRRSKLGLHLTPEARQQVADWMEHHRFAQPAAVSG